MRKTNLTTPELDVRIEAMRFPDSDTALMSDLVLTVRSGETVALLGPTGAGKSTLFRMIAGLEDRFKGHVTLNGTRITSPTRRIQLVFQDYRLLPWKTVYRNVAFACNGKLDANDVDVVNGALARLKMTHRARAYPKTLSGGELAKVALARALVSLPDVLLLDEPFRNLDIVARYDVQDELRNALLDCPACVLLVSHNIEDAVYLSDRILVLSANPMRIAKEVRIDVERPRKRSDPRLAAATGELADYLSRPTNSGYDGRVPSQSPS